MTARESDLEAALRANAALRSRAEKQIAAYVMPESDRAAIINDLIDLFNGPDQQEAEMVKARALCKRRHEHRPDEWRLVSL
jgi:TfoX/Sxy family transcriptional regulator of competence genes